MTIRDPKTYGEAAWDWGFLTECFGYSNSRVGDIDGILSHCGEILILEGRSLSRAPDVGKIFLNHKDRNNGQVRVWKDCTATGLTVLTMWGDAENSKTPNLKIPKRMQIWLKGEQQPYPVTEASYELVKVQISKWWKWTELQERLHVEARNAYRKLGKKVA